MLEMQKKTTTQKKAMRKLHSLHALINERSFVGVIEAGSLKYQFTYTLKQVASVAGKLEFSGTVSIKTPTGKINEATNVKAQLASIQAAIATASKPPSFKLVVPSALPEDVPNGLPITEATGTRSAVGVLYLKLADLNGQGLGVPYDLSALQLNGRLVPIDQASRDIQWLVNQAVAALPNVQIAEPYVSELDRLLRA